jgi:hypothetical protein
MQFSSDGTNWDRSKNVVVDQDIGSGSVHTLETVAQYFRVQYTNCTTAQTHFRLQALYHRHRSGFLTSSPDERISKVNDAQIMRVANDPFLDLSRDLYKDKFVIHQDGVNDATPGSSTERDIWLYGATDNGDADITWLRTGEVVRVAAGGNAADASNSTGAAMVTIDGLDTNWNILVESVETSGATNSASTTNAFIRVNDFWVSAVGTYGGANTGDITIETESGIAMGFITAGVGGSEQSHYSVPTGHTAYVRHVHGDVSAGANKEATLVAYKRENAGMTDPPFIGGSKRQIHVWEDLNGSAELDFFASVKLPQQTDFWWTSIAANASKVSVVYDLIVVQGESPTDPQ